MRPSRILFAILCVVLVAACASVSVEPKKSISSTASIAPPSIIYVHLFDTTTGLWEGPVAGDTARERIARSLGENLESRIGEIVPTAKLVQAETPTPSDGWLVTGKIIRVNPGGKWTRLMIGLGAGGSKFETEVSVFDLTHSAVEPILVFSTTGGSNTEGGTSQFNDATGEDIDRTAREVRDYLKEQIGKL